MPLYQSSHVATLLLCLVMGSTTAQEKRVAVAINTSQTRDQISPYIYSQFIEHLGRCIYGGIWAEMLEDRKFYFSVTKQYDPYKLLKDTDFPVVGASPWQVVGDQDGVTMDTQSPFVGDHTPQIAGGSGIQQRDLALVEGKEYVGYVWLKGDTSVRVSLQTSEDAAPKQLAAIDSGGDYTKHDFRFTAPTNTDKAILRIDVADTGSVHLGTASLMPADNVRGMRPDTLAVLKELDSPMYRWPGGNFVSGYEWRDGIGDRDRRPPRKNPAWTGVEHNDVGIIEFIDFCREVGAEPLIAANTGFGDPHSAAAEVEFCNSSTDTYGGRLRAEVGHPEPLNVKYWCVGNEMFGNWQLGYMQLGQYVLKHNRTAKRMLAADPTLELIGVGELGGKDPTHDPGRKYGWSETMLRECADHMDYLSEHFYVGRTPWSRGGSPFSVAEHVDEMRQAIRKKADGHRQLQDRLGLTGDKRVPIAMDEWNYWHRDYDFGELGCRYDLSDALGVAVGLHEYFRNTDIIHMAHYAQTVNVIGCIKTTKTDAFMATTALPLMIYRKHFGKTPIELAIDGQAHGVDISAALDEGGKVLTLGIVNPNAEAVVIDLAYEGRHAIREAEQWVVAGGDPRAYNDADNKRLDVAHSQIQLGNQWTAPGYSFAVIRVPLQ